MRAALAASSDPGESARAGPDTPTAATTFEIACARRAANLAVGVSPTGEGARGNRDRGHQLVRARGSRAVADEEVRQGEGPPFDASTFAPGELHPGVEREQDRRRVRGGRGVAEASAQGAAILDGDGADRRGHLGEDGSAPQDRPRVAQVGVGRARSEPQSGGGALDAAELVEQRQVEVATRGRPAVVQQDEEIGAAGQGHRPVGVGERRQRLREAPRPHHLEGPRVAPHPAARPVRRCLGFARAAAATASTIFT